MKEFDKCENCYGIVGRSCSAWRRDLKAKYISCCDNSMKYYANKEEVDGYVNDFEMGIVCDDIIKKLKLPYTTINGLSIIETLDKIDINVLISTTPTLEYINLDFIITSPLKDKKFKIIKFFDVDTLSEDDDFDPKLFKEFHKSETGISFEIGWHVVGGFEQDKFIPELLRLGYIEEIIDTVDHEVIKGSSFMHEEFGLCVIMEVNDDIFKFMSIDVCNRLTDNEIKLHDHMMLSEFIEGSVGKIEDFRPVGNIKFGTFDPNK